MEADKLTALNKLNKFKATRTKKQNNLFQQQQYLQLCMLDPEEETSKLFIIMAEMHINLKMAISLKKSQQEMCAEERKQEAGTNLQVENGNPVLTDEGAPILLV